MEIFDPINVFFGFRKNFYISTHAIARKKMLAIISSTEMRHEIAEYNQKLELH